jgi:hypothetical protein
METRLDSESDMETPSPWNELTAVRLGTRLGKTGAYIQLDLATSVWTLMNLLEPAAVGSGPGRSKETRSDADQSME